MCASLHHQTMTPDMWGNKAQCVYSRPLSRSMFLASLSQLLGQFMDIKLPLKPSYNHTNTYICIRELILLQGRVLCTTTVLHCCLLQQSHNKPPDRELSLFIGSPVGKLYPQYSLNRGISACYNLISHCPPSKLWFLAQECGIHTMASYWWL